MRKMPQCLKEFEYKTPKRNEILISNIMGVKPVNLIVYLHLTHV